MTDSIQLFSVLPNGISKLPLDSAVQHVHEVMDGHVSGVYTGLRSFGGRRFLGLAEHLDRLEESMQKMGFPLPLEREDLRRALDLVLREQGLDAGDSFLRIDVLPPGVFFPGSQSRVLITRGELMLVPQEFMQEGVAVAFAEDLRRANPSIKTSDFVLARRPYPLGTRAAYEHLMLDDEGYILEATSANFYGILDGELRTATRGVLAGITRRFLLFLCAGIELPVNTNALHRDQLSSLEEAFLTSSTRGIVPVIRVAGVPIGAGLPGEHTKSLIRSYGVHCQRSATPAWPPASP